VVKIEFMYLNLIGVTGVYHLEVNIDHIISIISNMFKLCNDLHFTYLYKCAKLQSESNVALRFEPRLQENAF